MVEDQHLGDIGHRYKVSGYSYNNVVWETSMVHKIEMMELHFSLFGYSTFLSDQCQRSGKEKKLELIQESTHSAATFWGEKPIR